MLETLVYARSANLVSACIGDAGWHVPLLQKKLDWFQALCEYRKCCFGVHWGCRLARPSASARNPLVLSTIYIYYKYGISPPNLLPEHATSRNTPKVDWRRRIMCLVRWLAPPNLLFGVTWKSKHARKRI